ncbi:nuclear transport factor 2 family protein [uncultured Allomuricauda sp.]|uniref:nuclear transport factor 2 family protein n=1 Tax=Flagellimonas sp. W118 TaxID=3410791 RepID=UPI002609F16C|nr:nuclear transport factor 2 family protein [uncultured Allomuricauda sp.]
MKQLLTILLLCCAFSSFGQQKNIVSNETIEAIRDDVWIPFMEAYAEFDSDKLKSIHSKDIVRITIDQNQIETGENYLENFGGFLQHMKQGGNEVAIAFAIQSTAIDEGGALAYQTGYYRYSSKRNGEEKLIPRGYGYFNVALKKENEIWKLWLDSDKQTDISDEDFQAQEILYELMK